MELKELFAAQLQLSAERLQASLQDLSGAEARERPYGLAPAVWQIGHVAYHDGELVRRAGHSPPVPGDYEKLFAMGTSGAGDFPALEEVAACFADVHQRLLEVARGDPAREIQGPRGPVSLSRALFVQDWHRAYHTGKIMTLRGLLGKPRLI